MKNQATLLLVWLNCALALSTKTKLPKRDSSPSKTEGGMQKSLLHSPGVMISDRTARAMYYGGGASEIDCPHCAIYVEAAGRGWPGGQGGGGGGGGWPGGLGSAGWGTGWQGGDAGGWGWGGSGSGGWQGGWGWKPPGWQGGGGSKPPQADWIQDHIYRCDNGKASTTVTNYWTLKCSNADAYCRDCGGKRWCFIEAGDVDKYNSCCKGSSGDWGESHLNETGLSKYFIKNCTPITVINGAELDVLTTSS